MLYKGESEGWLMWMMATLCGETGRDELGEADKLLRCQLLFGGEFTLL